MYYADSRDLYAWEDRGKVPDNGERRPQGFLVERIVLMIVDTWDGLGSIGLPTP